VSPNRYSTQTGGMLAIPPISHFGLTLDYKIEYGKNSFGGVMLLSCRASPLILFADTFLLKTSVLWIRDIFSSSFFEIHT
jgi:hypothetical protein